MEVTNSDWKLFKSRIVEWQENYMECLVKEYIEMLSGTGNASNKFWKLEKRVNNDKKQPGVMMESRKNNVIFDIVALINNGVITTADLEGFSDELKECVDYILNR